MKPRTRLTVVLAVLAVAVDLAWSFWPRDTEAAVLRLKIVKQTTEQGKPVVFFRVEGAQGQRIRMGRVWRILEGGPVRIIGFLSTLALALG